MKNDIRAAAMNAVSKMLTDNVENLIPVRVSKKDCFAVDTAISDENGETIYATIEVTVKNPVATKVSAGFDIEEAIAARKENDEKPKPERKTAKAVDPEKVAKREAQMKILRDWCLENLSTDEAMTATQIKEAIPEFAEVTVMQVGKWLKTMADGEMTILREMKDGKPVYTHK